MHAMRPVASMQERAYVTFPPLLHSTRGYSVYFPACFFQAAIQSSALGLVPVALPEAGAEGVLGTPVSAESPTTAATAAPATTTPMGASLLMSLEEEADAADSVEEAGLAAGFAFSTTGAFLGSTTAFAGGGGVVGAAGVGGAFGVSFFTGATGAAGGSTAATSFFATTTSFFGGVAAGASTFTGLGGANLTGPSIDLPFLAASMSLMAWNSSLVLYDMEMSVRDFDPNSGGFMILPPTVRNAPPAATVAARRPPA
mmetsp:Transcript_2928/g.4012  ORF Transcript_2928/g.4012 Transcript_2928/m.4012 type:complete len:256 (+) Transcript_2928:95-862(+)